MLDAAIGYWPPLSSREIIVFPTGADEPVPTEAGRLNAAGDPILAASARQGADEDGRDRNCSGSFDAAVAIQNLRQCREPGNSRWAL